MSTLPGPRGSGPGGPPGNESSRLMLTMAVSLGLVIVFQNVFEKPVAPVPAPQPGQASSSGAPAVVAPGQPAPAPGTVAPAPGAVAEEPPQPEQVVRLEGAKLKLGLSTLGGRVVDAQLPDFVEHDGKSKKRGDFVDVVSLKGDLGGDLRLSFAGLSPTASYRINSRVRVFFEMTNFTSEYTYDSTMGPDRGIQKNLIQNSWIGTVGLGWRL